MAGKLTPRRESPPPVTRLRDRLAAGLTVDVPDGPDAYQAGGWILRLVAIVALAGVGFALLAALFLLPMLTFFGFLAETFGEGFWAVGAAFVAIAVAALLAAVLLLLVVNHLYVGWTARAGWALWGTRAFTGLAVVSAVVPATQAAGGSDPLAALSGLGVGTVVLAVLHVLTWMEGTRAAFEEERGEGGDVDAVLETD